MAVKAVTVWQADDGRNFESREAANKHNAQAKIINGVKSIIGEAIPNKDFSILHINLVNDPKAATAMRDMMNKVLEYHRNYGKLKK